jgi:alpha-tubulin suppressor-like RCC1 family protein
VVEWGLSNGVNPFNSGISKIAGGRMHLLTLTDAGLQSGWGNSTQGELSINANPFGGTITEMPLGVAMTCGGGMATAQIDLRDTPFSVETTFGSFGDAGATAHADRWENKQTVELWADGNCGWIAPEVGKTGVAIKLAFL